LRKFLGIGVITGSCRGNSLVQRLMQSRSLVLVEVIVDCRYIDGLQVHHFSLRQIGRFVENEPTIADLSFERVHQATG
jgi:hypothetical protein